MPENKPLTAAIELFGARLQYTAELERCVANQEVTGVVRLQTGVPFPAALPPALKALLDKLEGNLSSGDQRRVAELLGFMKHLAVLQAAELYIPKI